MRDLLYLAHRLPYPPDKGDKVRSFHEVRHLARHFRVHLGAFVDDPDDWRHVPALAQYCGETHFAPLARVTAPLRYLAGLARGEALSVAYYRDAGMARWVERMLAGHAIGHAMIFSSPMAQYLPRRAGLVRIADLVDVDSDKWRAYAATRPWPLSWIYAREAVKLAAFERAVAAGFDATLLVAPGEAARLREIAPESATRIEHLGNGVDAQYFSPEVAFASPFAPGEPAIVFTGAMNYWPNVDAVTWFAAEILPLVRRRHPRAHFWIVGRKPSAAVRRLAALDGVTVAGSVRDVRPYLAHANLAVAPLRIAHGMQNKILEAMAMARAVVATGASAAAVTARAGSEILVASDREAFAEAVSTYLVSDARHAIGAAARARVLESYAWQPSLERLDGLLLGGAAA